MRIQDADEGHLEGIAGIYNDAVLHSTAIWNDRTVDAADRRAWLAGRVSAGFPVLVALDEGRVVGYASYGPWRAFDGFRHTVEHSVYVRGDQRGRGLGRALMAALVERARSSGVHVMVAAVERGNLASIRLHEQLGFSCAGVVEQAGAKFGRWLDLAFLQLVLDDREAPPDDRSDIR